MVAGSSPLLCYSSAVQMELRGTNTGQVKMLSSGCLDVDILISSVTPHLRHATHTTKLGNDCIRLVMKI